MSKFRSVVSFKIWKLPQKSRNLRDDPEEIVRSRMVMHLEAFDGFVVLDNWVERSFFKFLPVSAKIVLRIRIEEKKEVLNIRNDLFQFEVVACTVKLEGFFFTLFSIGVAAAETAVALAIIINVYRNYHSDQVNSIENMKF